MRNCCTVTLVVTVLCASITFANGNGMMGDGMKKGTEVKGEKSSMVTKGPSFANLLKNMDLLVVTSQKSSEKQKAAVVGGKVVKRVGLPPCNKTKSAVTTTKKPSEKQNPPVTVKPALSDKQLTQKPKKKCDKKKAVTGATTKKVELSDKQLTQKPKKKCNKKKAVTGATPKKVELSDKQLTQKPKKKCNKKKAVTGATTKKVELSDKQLTQKPKKKCNKKKTVKPNGSGVVTKSPIGDKANNGKLPGENYFLLIEILEHLHILALFTVR